MVERDVKKGRRYITPRRWVCHCYRMVVLLPASELRDLEIHHFTPGCLAPLLLHNQVYAATVRSYFSYPLRSQHIVYF
jgi:hypothetical protein